MKADSRFKTTYIRFRKGRISETINPRPGILIDLNTKGDVIGIEILSGMRHIKR